MGKTLKDRPYRVIAADPDSVPDSVSNYGGEAEGVFHRTGYQGGEAKAWRRREQNRRSRRNARLSLRTGRNRGPQRGETQATGRSQAIWDAN